jgi:glycosidase
MRQILTVFLSFLFTQLSLSQSPTLRVEPPNWWTGMHHSTIELMVYGENAGSLFPQIEYPGVSLRRVSPADHPDYLFVEIAISKDANPGQIPISWMKNGEVVNQTPFPLLQRRFAPESLEGFRPSDVMCLITPDRFANGDPTNDGSREMLEGPDRTTKGGRHGGDLAGIMQHLDYLDNLGYTALWLNPVLENNMSTHSYHGYAITDFYRVDPRYGSNAVYRDLADSLRDRGMKLILDQVMNHCGSNHWWMDNLPFADWINQWPEYTETNHRRTTLQDPHAALADRKRFSDGWFVPSMPDLNQRNAHLSRYLIQNSIWWVEYLGAAGIRMDTWSYPDKEFMAAWTNAIMTEYPELSIVGEEWYTQPSVVSYWQRDKSNPDGYSTSLGSLMDFPVQTALVQSLRSEESWNSGWMTLYEMLAQDFLYPNPDNLVIFADNHDMSRIYTQLDEDADLTKIALAFVLTARGIPQVYYGTEILMGVPDNTDHGIIRSDFPGGWSGDATNAFTGKRLTAEQADMQHFVKTLLNWRKSSKAIHHGKLIHWNPEQGTYVYFRRADNDETVMVVLNKSDQDATLDPSRFEEVLNERRSGINVLTQSRMDFSSSLVAPARSALILEIE